MSNFVTDSTNLSYPKADLGGVPSGASTSRYVQASDWNTLCQAAVDIRTYITTGLTIGSNGAVTFMGKIAGSLTAFQITDPGNAGAIPVTYNGTCNLVSAGAETRTIAAPTYVGQTIALAFKTDGGDIVVTVSAAYNQAGNTTITVNDAGDFALLSAIYIGASLRWRLVVNDGCTLG